MGNQFKYDRLLRDSTGRAWYCQVPGVHWAVDPADGWYVFLTDGPSWYLMGNGYELSLSTTKLKEAINEAAAIITEIKAGTWGHQR